MIALTLSVLLAALGIAVFPCWPHSARWGYGPALTVGGLLILVAAMTIGSRPLNDANRTAFARAAQQTIEISVATPPSLLGDPAHP